MAGYRDSNASEKKSSEAINDLPTFNFENLQSNMNVIYYSWTFMSIIGGVIAGILGFNGLMGFVLYFSLWPSLQLEKNGAQPASQPKKRGIPPAYLFQQKGYNILIIYWWVNVFSLLKIIHFFSLFSISFTTLFHIPCI
ncbi:hypothetical protein UlMin_024574 [Ulmus minor]